MNEVQSERVTIARLWCNNSFRILKLIAACLILYFAAKFGLITTFIGLLVGGLFFLPMSAGEITLNLNTEHLSQSIDRFVDKVDEARREKPGPQLIPV